MADPRLLKLQSPAYGEPIFYKWPLVVTKRLDEPAEIAETIRLVCDDFPELKYAVENVILKDYDSKDYDSMNQLCQRYNKAIRNILSLWKGRAPPPRMFQPPNKELLRHILNLCYSHAIKEPEKLNLYEPFSPEVYGETSFDMVSQILDEIQVSNEETFLDLGSGVGQVVLQAAASNLFKECNGVEKADTPAEYSNAMETEFKKWMDWFGKIYTDFRLEKGDFMDEKWKDVINECGVVFVNNFAFGPVVNHHLKTRFTSMKEGSKVISSREFVPMNFKFNKRNLSELGAMIRVTEIKPRGEAATVSWTGNSVSYFLHVVDRTRLEKYFSILKKKKEGQELDEDEMSLCSESNNSVDTSGTPLDIETLEENLDDLYLGTTTRHQWQLLTDTINQSKQDGTKVMPGREAKTRGRIKVTQQGLIRKSGKLQMKNKILQKYCHQKPKKRAIISSQDSLDSSDGPDTANSKPKSLKGKKIIKTPKENKEQKVKQKEKGNLKHKSNSVKLKPGRRRMVTQRMKSLSSNEDSDCDSASASLSKCIVESKSQKTQKNTLEEELDKFLAVMKGRFLEFIKRINMKEYADRLKVMIECETAKKKLLTQEINETERMVQNLISDSLRNFSSRLVELDLAVKTPLDLLSKSSVLAEKHQELENKVVNMEIEVFNLEEKYKILCAARNQKNRKCGLEPMIDSDPDEIIENFEETDRKKELETKLCGAILTALNHRRSLMDQQSSLSEQISILEKISHTNGQGSGDPSANMEEKDAIKTDEKPNRPKSRPVAFVPPRMLSDNKKNTVSPEATSEQSLFPENRGRRSRHRQRTKTAEEHAQSPSGRSDSSQDSKTDLEDRSSSATVRSERSVLLNIETSTVSVQMSCGNRQFVTYQAQEQRAPITFPRNPLDDLKVDSKHPSGMKSTKQFLKTSGKLLNAAPNKWCSFQAIQSERFPNTGSWHPITKASNSFTSSEDNNIRNLSLNNITHDKISSQNTIKNIDSKVSVSLFEKVSMTEGLSGISSFKAKSILDKHPTLSIPSPINSFLSNSPQVETRFQTNLYSSTYVSSISDGNSSFRDIPTLLGHTSPATSKPSPTYGISIPFTLNLAVRHAANTNCTNTLRSAAVVFPSTTQLHIKGDKISSEIDSVRIKSSITPINRNPSSVWTSSTFSVTQLQPPKPSKKSTKCLASLIGVSSRINPSSLIPTCNSAAVNLRTDVSSNLSLVSTSMSFPLMFGSGIVLSTSTRNGDNTMKVNNLLPVSSSTQQLFSSENKMNIPPCTNITDMQNMKRKGQNPNIDMKRTADAIHAKNPHDRYHYPYTKLSSKSIPTGRTLVPDASMKLNLEESFHRQYTNPDVEDHFRTTFNNIVQNANRESLNIILEKGKVVKGSDSISTTAANLVAINQGSSYLATPNEVGTCNINNKNIGMSGHDPNRSHGVYGRGAVISFAVDKPIPYPRSHKDRPEIPANAHGHYRRPASTPISPLHRKSGVAATNQIASFPSGSSATPLYCPSTMKLLKTNLDNSKIPPGNLLMAVTRNPNDMPSPYQKMVVLPTPAPKTASVVSVNHHEVKRCPRKPNPDMFLNTFSGGTFIPPSAPGGRPTFIPSLPTVIQERNIHSKSDVTLRAPPSKKGRGRKPKHISKSASTTTSVGIPDNIDFSKSPPNSVNIPIYNTPPNNINAGFRPPIIRNPIPSIQNPLALSLDARGLRPQILKQNTQTHSSIPNRLAVPRPPLVQSSSSAAFPNRSTHPVSSTTIQQGQCPRSPTYNHPRFVLLNMPTVMMVSTPSSETTQVLQRQHSMTSPTFPPPNS